VVGQDAHAVIGAHHIFLEDDFNVHLIDNLAELVDADVPVHTHLVEGTDVQVLPLVQDSKAGAPTLIGQLATELSSGVVADVPGETADFGG
jgi:hypothetical protein